MMFLAKYSEKAGSGILEMIALCQKAGLPTPEFRQSGGQFIQTLGRGRSEVTPEVTPEVRLVRALVGEMTRQQLQRALELRDDEHFRKALEEMMDEYIHLRHKAHDVFEMRYQESIDPDKDRWELCSKVLARRDVVDRLSAPW